MPTINISGLFLIFIFLTSQAAGSAQPLTLVSQGIPRSVIVIPDNPTLVEIQASKVLQDYIERVSGALLVIGSDQKKSTAVEILIGRVNRPALKQISLEKLEKDGILIKNNGKQLVITGGTEKGVLYAVYTFIEKYLGCRKYTSAVTYVPKKKTIVVGLINDEQVPSFTYRENFYRDATDPEYQAWHKLDSHGETGANTSEWGSWVHTMEGLISPVEYGTTHPEYFSYYSGKRHTGVVPSWDKKSVQPEAQPCLSNPEVLEIVCKNLQAAINKNPAALYWSVSQNDNVNYCQCENCAALDKKYAAFEPEEKMYSTQGSRKYPALGMGSLLTFVNRVAERFPDKIISTLAYQYTRVPPKDIVPGKNVNIMLCNIESLRNLTIEKGDSSFSNDLRGWGKLTSNIIIWDYVIQFSNLVSPFPNLMTLQPNLQFFRDNRVSAMFEQANRETGGEFAELRGYMISKLLWNPDVNINQVMDDFLPGYYGNASKYIKQYITLLHKNASEETGVKLSIFGSPIKEKDSYLSDSLMHAYDAIFDKAEAAVTGMPELLNRVRSARLPVYYARLEIARSEKTGKRGAFVAGTGNTLQPNEKIVQALYNFVYHCIRNNVSRVTEWHTIPMEYLAAYTKFLETTSQQAGSAAN